MAPRPPLSHSFGVILVLSFLNQSVRKLGSSCLGDSFWRPIRDEADGKRFFTKSTADMLDALAGWEWVR